MTLQSNIRTTWPTPSHSGASIYVVDDDAAVLNSLGFALEVEGFAVHLFRTGSELLTVPEIASQGCLLIDLALDGEDNDGLDLLATLRRRGVTLPAILMTSNPTRDVRRRAAAASVPIVEKPDLVPAVIDRIERSIGRT
jgi:FixJ family two-component response regulator